MPNRKTGKGVLLTNPMIWETYISRFSQEELERALPRLSFFDCHAKAIRGSEENADPQKSSKEKAVTDLGDTSSKIFDASRSEQSSLQHMTDIDNKSKTLTEPIMNGSASALDSCKIPDNDESSANVKLSIPNYLEDDSAAHGNPNTQTKNTEDLQNAGMKNPEEGEVTFHKIYESSGSMGSFKIKNSDPISKIEKEVSIKAAAKHNSKSEGFQNLMEYLLCLKNTHPDNEDKIDSSCPKMKSSDPKYFVDSLKKSASIFAFQHRVYGQMNNDLFTAAVRELHSRFIVSANRSTNSDPSSDKSYSELDTHRHKLDQWIDRVSTNEFMRITEDVLSVLGDSNCQQGPSLGHCRYLRLPPSQLRYFESLKD